MTEKLEQISVGDSLRAIRFAEVVVLLVAADQPMDKQDLMIARLVVDEGRALVIAINKWDACADRPAALRRTRDRLERSLPQVRGVTLIPISATQGDNLERLLDAVIEAYEVWNKRVATAALNRWLQAATGDHPPPAAQGRRNRLKYATQAKARPPTFAIFCSRPQDLPGSYLRYLENSLRETFALPGTPIRINFRQSRNPYVES